MKYIFFGAVVLSGLLFQNCAQIDEATLVCSEGEECARSKVRAQDVQFQQYLKSQYPTLCRYSQVSDLPVKPGYTVYTCQGGGNLQSLLSDIDRVLGADGVSEYRRAELDSRLPFAGRRDKIPFAKRTSDGAILPLFTQDRLVDLLQNYRQDSLPEALARSQIYYRSWFPSAKLYRTRRGYKIVSIDHCQQTGRVFQIQDGIPSFHEQSISSQHECLIAFAEAVNPN